MSDWLLSDLYTAWTIREQTVITVTLVICVKAACHRLVLADKGMLILPRLLLHLLIRRHEGIARMVFGV